MLKSHCHLLSRRLRTVAVPLFTGLLSCFCVLAQAQGIRSEAQSRMLGNRVDTNGARSSEPDADTRRRAMRRAEPETRNSLAPGLQKKGFGMAEPGTTPQAREAARKKKQARAMRKARLKEAQRRQQRNMLEEKREEERRREQRRQ